MIPDEIGKSSNEEDHLLNGYYRTEAGLYVPSMVSFFGDSYARALLGVWPLIRNISKYGTADEDMTEFTSQDSHDEVVGMISVNDLDSDILVVSENGYGKRSSLDGYRMTNRGGKGVKTISITEKTGELVTIKNVTDNDDLMIINKSGIAIRMEVSSLRVMGRATQGVKLINLKDTDSIAAVAKVVHDDDDISDVEEIDVVEKNNDNDLN